MLFFGSENVPSAANRFAVGFIREPNVLSR